MSETLISEGDYEHLQKHEDLVVWLLDGQKGNSVLDNVYAYC